MVRGIFRPAGVVALLALVGCTSSARYVVKNADGGVVAIPENTNAWPTFYRSKARELMEKHIPDGYVIDREEEFVTGTVTDTTVHIDPTVIGALAGAEKARQQGVSRNVTEWRIHYKARTTPGLIPMLTETAPPPVLLGATRPSDLPQVAPPVALQPPVTEAEVVEGPAAATIAIGQVR